MSFALALAVAAASGFIALSYEILWYRVIAFASWGLPGAFGLLLSAYLFGLAFGSRVAGAFCKDDAQQGDVGQLRIVAAFVFVANLVAWLVVPAFGWSAKRWDWPPALLMVLLAAGLLGAILPLVSHFGIKPDDRAGQRLSYVYLANIVGSAAGSLLTGFVLLDAFPLAKASAIIGLLGIILFAAVLLAARVYRLLPVAGLAAACVGLVTEAAYDRIWERLMYKGAFTPDTKFADIIETKSGVITVTQNDVVYGGGAYDGKFNTSLRWDKNGIMRAYAVGALHPAPRRMLMIGLASGSWAKVLSNLPGLEKLTIVEINPGYTQLIAKHEEVASILTDERVEIVIDDGRRWLNRHDDAFDVIVQNTTWHWRAHITNLLSEDYFAIIRAHLAPGGFFFFNTTSSADVQKTAASFFPHAMRVYNFMAVSDAPLSFDKALWKKTLEDTRVDGEPAVDRSDDDGQKLMAELLEWPDTIDAAPRDDGLETRESLLARTQGALTVTDDNMVPEWTKVLRFQDPP
jgi:spermidine synthase